MPPNTLMRPSVVVVIALVFSHHAPQIVFIQHSEFVQAFFTDASYPPFSVSVGIGSPNRRTNDPDVFRGKNGIKCVCELAVSVTDEKAQHGSEFLDDPDELAALLGHPRRGRLRRTTGKVSASGANLNGEERGQRLRKQGLNGEEVTGNKQLFRKGHDLSPAQRGAALGESWNAVTFQNVGDGLIADLYPQLA